MTIRLVGGGSLFPSKFTMSKSPQVQRLFAVCVLVGIGASTYFFGSGRFDYAAHFLAGAGGTLVLVAFKNACWVLLSTLWPSQFTDSRMAIAIATLASIGLGLVAEFTVFAAPVADILDIVHQSLGAIVVGLVCIRFYTNQQSLISVLVLEGVAAVLGTAMIIVGADLVGIV